MSDQDDPADKPTAAPFLGALVIIVVVITGIFLFNRHSGDGAAGEIGTAVSGQNDALQRQSYPDFVKYTCAQQRGTQDQVLARQRDSVGKRGERYVDGVGNVAVDGEHATARVIYHFKNDEDAKLTTDLSLVREDGAWKVCAPTPS